MKIVQLTGVGKFERIARHYVNDEPIAFATPNTLKINVERFNVIFNKPSDFFRKNVEYFEKNGEIRFFAVDSVKNVKKYIIAHEIGHKLFYDSMLPNKYERLKEIYFKTVEDKSIKLISGYAQLSANNGDFEEFFAEIFAMWARKDLNLLGYVSNFVEEVLM